MRPRDLFVTASLTRVEYLPEHGEAEQRGPVEGPEHPPPVQQRPGHGAQQRLARRVHRVREGAPQHALLGRHQLHACGGKDHYTPSDRLFMLPRKEIDCGGVTETLNRLFDPTEWDEFHFSGGEGEHPLRNDLSKRCR